MNFDGFIGPSYTLDSKNIDSQRCVNFYPKLNEIGKGKSAQVASLISTPGLSLLVDLGIGPIRGAYTATNGHLYVVSGNRLYYINSLWRAVVVGELKTSTGQVDFADNGQTLVFVDGPNGYWHTLGSSISTEFSGSEWKGSTKVEYLDGYFIFIEPESGRFYISNLNSIIIDGLDFASTNGDPDNILSVLVNHGEVWLFGESSIEAWYNSGNADFPFSRISGGVMEMGLTSPYSVANIGRTNFWLGKNRDGSGIVYSATGLAPQRISTHAVEIAIQSYGDISDAVAWTYQENGHSFYVLNFTSANTTWVYDLTTGLWHERAYLENGKFQRSRANCHSFAYNTHVVGDYANGKLYKLDSSSYTDNGNPIRRERIAPHLSQSLKRVIHHSFQIDMESGVGINSLSQGHEPKIMLQFSDDGGHTWSNEKWKNIGKIGKRNTRIKWNRLGASRDRVYKVAITDPVKCNLISAEIEVEGLVS